MRMSVKSRHHGSEHERSADVDGKGDPRNVVSIAGEKPVEAVASSCSGGAAKATVRKTGTVGSLRP